MRVSTREKGLSHSKIVKSASRLFRERGIATTNVNDLMSEAGMTHGGFYRHFKDKNELVSEAMIAAIGEMTQLLDELIEKNGNRKAAIEFRIKYLSKSHLKSPGQGCPLPLLSAEVSRVEGLDRQKIANSVHILIDKLSAEAGSKKNEEAKRVAARVLSEMVGAVAISRLFSEAEADEFLKLIR